MRPNIQNPHTQRYKDQAKALRRELTATGHPITHSAALELVAKQNGARDWNTLSAQAATPTPVVGGPVTGRYMGHTFTGIVKSLSQVGTAHRIAIQLDEPIDVVAFDSFSAMRSRITATINAQGISHSHTSDGVPHLVVHGVDW
ncbi:glyoxalase superfamily protein [Algirhabdus cladophorae]|uniref:glyoxalase superfamily protein n=1 Tax=Algirhabdus cladophorae TaxID=3377108 RepID=UPI003B84B4E3